MLSSDFAAVHSGLALGLYKAQRLNDGDDGAGLAQLHYQAHSIEKETSKE